MSEAKQERKRVIQRSYDYAKGTGTLKDSETGAVLAQVSLSDLPDNVVQKLALSALMGVVGGEGTEAARNGENVKEALETAFLELQQDQVEFRDGGTSVAMGGTLKRVGRALVELGLVFAKGPNGTCYTWDASKANQPGFVYSGSTGIEGAYQAMKQLWDVPATNNYVSGRTLFNKIKQVPEVAAKLQAYAAAKGAKGVVLG